MKYAVLGTGKTGSHLLELIPAQNLVGAFNSQNPPTFDALMSADVIISFLTGDVFKSYIPLLLETQKRVVIGSTGFDWPADIEQSLQNSGASWLYATNFSLGVQSLRLMSAQMQKMQSLFSNADLSIEEIHHTQKQDAPSGTAKSLSEWLGGDIPIESIREGDIVGTHTIQLTSDYENLTLTHEATDRKLFASGALWASQFFYNQNTNPGLYKFEDLLVQYFNEIQ